MLKTIIMASIASTAIIAPVATQQVAITDVQGQAKGTKSGTFVKDGLKYVQIASEWKDEVIYQIFPIAYKDSDKDRIGDLNGIKESIPYLKNLGVTAIWVTPIQKSPSYHKYDTSDYYAVDPVFGTMNDFENLITELHKNGMKYVMDLALNHSSTSNSWFYNAVNLNAPEHDKYKDFYKIEDNRNKQETKNTDTWLDISQLRYDNPTTFYDANHLRKGVFYSAFKTGSMADLNLQNKAVQDEIFNVAKFWMDKGVDGFRLDATRHAYNDTEYEYNSKFDASQLNQDIWTNFSEKVINYGNSKGKSMYIVGENAFGNSYELKQYTSSFSQLNFPFYYKMLDRMTGKSSTDIFKDYTTDLDYYKKLSWANVNFTGQTDLNGGYRLHEGNPSYMDTTFIGNHDNSRVRSVLNNSAALAKLAATMQMLLTGVPVIYYGDELGLLGAKNGKNDFNQRQAMPWNKDMVSIKYSYIYKYGDIYDGIKLNDKDLNAENEQNIAKTSTDTEKMADENATNTFALYKKIIAFRKDKDFIKHPSNIYDYYTNTGGNVTGIKYKYGDKEYVVFANISPQNQTFDISGIVKKGRYQNATFQDDAGIEKATYNLGSNKAQVYKVLGDYSTDMSNAKLTLNSHSVVIVSFQ